MTQLFFALQTYCCCCLCLVLCTQYYSQRTITRTQYECLHSIQHSNRQLTAYSSSIGTQYQPADCSRFMTIINRFYIEMINSKKNSNTLTADQTNVKAKCGRWLGSIIHVNSRPHLNHFSRDIVPTHQGQKEFFFFDFHEKLINYSLGLLEFKSVGIFLKIFITD